MNDANLLCIMFNFGVPLEDIFPRKHIHPKLHNLFVEAHDAFKNSRLSLDHVLSGFQGSFTDAFNIKEAVVTGNPPNTEKASPATYFWLLRHFFGLLPLPLFPRFTDGQFYNWEFLSARCRLNYMRCNWQLESEISWWIHKLPKANVLLIYTLIEFLRKVCLKRQKLDWESIKTVTFYFSSSLFFRPYRPGFVTKADGLYSSLLRFLVVKWSRIRRSKLNKESYIDHQLSLLQSFDEDVEKEFEDNEKEFEDVEKEFEDSGCQTSSWLLSGAEERSSLVTGPQNVSKSVEYNNLNFDDNHSYILPQECEDESQNGVASEYQLQCEDKSQNSAASVSQSQQSHNSEAVYEDPDKVCNVTNSETMIYTKSDTKLTTPKDLFRKKMLKAHISLGSVISKIKQEMLKARSGTKLEEYKYNLLKDPVKKTNSLHANRCVKESPYIKYKKLMTL